ncbi:Phosphomannomutase/phosphoglucomutase [bacterium HR39]|nr:Phosphomannomutase/phosphoglucomutase [bacterium HR39]
MARQLEAEGAEVDRTDGVRVRRPEGWWLLRASNTQPVLVVRAEAEDEAGLARLCAEVRERLAAFGLEPPPGF